MIEKRDEVATQRILPVLAVFRDADQLGTFALDKRCITIGRSADNDIFLDDAGVSRRHAQIVTVLGESVIEDMGSRNGTFVNAKWIRTRQLAHGDAIAIARFRLVYQFVPDEALDEIGALLRNWGRGGAHAHDRRCAACGQPRGSHDLSETTPLVL